MPDTFHLIVLGGGPAGTSAAAGAAFLGKRVALVEKARELGGAGINTGTLPSKTLREMALVLTAGARGGSLASTPRSSAKPRLATSCGMQRTSPPPSARAPRRGAIAGK
jgi:pyruvate/2-oxoglutarate dehydrogenase complex dihydrolipoamide dehydrogenase (E3) component